MYDNANNEIQKLENEVYELSLKLAKLRKDSKPEPVNNYKFKDVAGEVSLASLFGTKETLIAIHNMGQGCRYCTLWADGIDAFLPHLESFSSVVLFSKDNPESQRQFANSRGWRFRMVSHAGTAYSLEQSVISGKENMPGVVVYQKQGDKIFKKNSSVFGPGDSFCSFWHLSSLAGVTEENFTPQYRYWAAPQKMDDGGANLT